MTPFELWTVRKCGVLWWTHGPGGKFGERRAFMSWRSAYDYAAGEARRAASRQIAYPIWRPGWWL